MKDDFMSTVTHELRTPLTSIRAFSEILLEDPKTNLENRKKFLAIIVKETERLTRLINQVLDMAKIESGNAEWHTAEIDLHEVIEESIAATSSLFTDKRIGLSMAPGRGCAQGEGGSRSLDPGHAEPAVECGQIL
jgi:signal transduction histidine kinase